jgi:hypothetical protein
MSITFKVYFNGVHQADTIHTYYNASCFSLQYYHLYSWRIDTYDTETGMTTTGDTWTFTTKVSPTNFSTLRPDDYRADAVWGWNPAGYNPTTFEYTGANEWVVWNTDLEEYEWFTWNSDTEQYEWIETSDPTAAEIFTELVAVGGGRYRNRVVVVGHNVVYFGDL